MNYERRHAYGMYKSRSGTAPSEQRHGPGPRLMGADTLIGNEVYNQADDNIGDIKEIMPDMRTGRVSYAAESLGGFLGVGDRLFAVPWDALSLDTANKRFRLDVEKKKLQGAPGFDNGHWPDMADPTPANGIHEYYGTKPYPVDSRI